MKRSNSRWIYKRSSCSSPIHVGIYTVKKRWWRWFGLSCAIKRT